MKKMGILFLVFASLLIPAYVSAASNPVDSVTVDSTNHILTVKGTIPENADKWITVEILRENVAWTSAEAEEGQLSLENYREGDSILDYLEFFGQINVGPESDYTITVRNYMRTSEPELRMRLGDDNFYYYSPKALAIINSAATTSALKNAVLGNSFLNAQIGTDYALLDDTQAEVFWGMLLDKRNSLDGGFSSFGAIIESAGEFIRITKLRSAQNTDDIKAVITLCADYGVSESNSYDLFLNSGVFSNGEMSEAQKNKMLKAFLAEKDTYTSVSAFVNDFLDKTVLYACSGNESKYYVNTILQKADRLTQENMGSFQSLGNTEKLEVCNAVNNPQPYATINALEEAVKYASSTADYEGSGSSGSSGSSGGGNAGGFAGSASLPAANENEAAAAGNGEAFTDLSEVEWAKEAIYNLQGKNIVSGRGNNLFDPMAFVLREEFVKMLVMALDCYDSSATEQFDDVDASAWYSRYVASAYQAGLIKGISASQFGTGRSITRQDMAVLLARASGGVINEKGYSGFSDDGQISGYAKDSVAYVLENGIMNGVGDNMFAPEEFVTRAQAAKAIYELIRRK